jgi:hypothetical protein
MGAARARNRARSGASFCACASNPAIDHEPSAVEPSRREAASSVDSSRLCAFSCDTTRAEAVQLGEGWSVIGRSRRGRDEPVTLPLKEFELLE